MKKLTMQDLNGEYLIMPMAGVSGELDAFRKHIMQKYPTIRIIDSSRYDLDTFTLCEMNSYVLLTQPVYQDIHPDLVTIPLKTKITLPYGLAYANEPTPAAQKFIDAVKSMVSLA